MNHDWHDLIQRYIAGTLSDDEALALQNALKSDEDLRALYLDYMNLDVALGSHAESRAAVNEILASPMAGETSRPARWLSWRPLTAAAAGIVFGMFCTSVVFAYVGSSLGKVLTLLQDSFESGSAPEVSGIPREIGKWSGDFTEIVGEQKGVKPANGKKMLRFLRADFEGKVKAEGSYISELYRLVDVRDYRREFGDGGAVAQLSAVFDAMAFPAVDSFDCSVSLYALDAETALALWKDESVIIARESLAMACSNRTRLDRDPKTWQPVTAEVRLPAHTDFLLIHIAVDHSTKSQRRVTFDGHYLDDVRLTLGRRAPLP